MKPSKLGIVITSILGALLVLIIGGILLSAPIPARAQAVSAKQPQMSGDACTIEWAAVPAPDPGSTFNTDLYTVDAVSSNDIWAVGVQRNPADGTRTGYVVHWNGIAWSAVPSPSIGQYPYVTLTSVAAISSNNVWVSGYSCQVGNCTTLLLRWNGSVFSIVPSPNVPSASNSLMDIAAISGNDIWAVGYSATDSFAYSPLALHWNGSAWSIVATPDLSAQRVSLTTVAAVSGNDVWAVGNSHHSTGSVIDSVSLHWNGTAWSISDMPVPSGYVEVTVNGAAAISSNDVWAIGTYRDFIVDEARTLTYHWDGTAWSVVPSPYSEDTWQHEFLNDISALTSNDIWAVGYSSNVGAENLLFLHWDGSAWSMVYSPYTTDDDGLGGVIMISPTDSWAVGYEQHLTGSGRYNRPIIQHTFQTCSTPTPTFTLTPEPPRCPSERFTDVCPDDYFYQPVLELNDGGIVAGYSSSPPCDSPLHVPCFKPYNSSTRAQISKVVSLAAGFSEPVSGQTFEDVVPGSTFYQYIERMAWRQIIIGYPCGGPGEPCVAPNNRPYFRPGNTVTRGQLSKMVTGAFGFTEPVSGQAFEDVQPGSTFYAYVGRIASRGIINGYPCGGAGEPCIPPNNRPYFRPSNAVTRGQTAKIVYLSMAQLTATPTLTVTPTAIPTSTSTPVPTLEPTSTSTVAPTATQTGLAR